MRIEMIATGDELVTGRLADTNSTWLGGELFALGEQLQRTTVVGDELDLIVGALREAGTRAQIVVVSGGLGPTLDDLSVDAACAAFGREPFVDDEQLARIRARFASIGRAVTPNNERQARVPSGSEVLGNGFGTATAFMVRDDSTGCLFFFLPGVPQEFQGIAKEWILPLLLERHEEEGIHRCYREVKCFGIPESHMDQAVRPLLADHPHVRYGTRVHFPESHVRLLAEGGSLEEAEARCDALDRAVREALGDVVFGAAGESLPQVTVEALRRRQWRVVFAESLTAGLAAATLAEAAGASEVLLGSSVTYDDTLKTRWLGVSEETLEVESAVSEAAARQMAEGALASSGADLAVSLTGYAGPGTAPDGTPAGTVFAAIAGGGRETQVALQQLPFGRNAVRRAAAFLALDLLRRRALESQAPQPSVPTGGRTETSVGARTRVR